MSDDRPDEVEDAILQAGRDLAYCDQGHPGRPSNQPCGPCEDEAAARTTPEEYAAWQHQAGLVKVHGGRIDVDPDVPDEDERDAQRFAFEHSMERD